MSIVLQQNLNPRYLDPSFTSLNLRDRNYKIEIEVLAMELVVNTTLTKLNLRGNKIKAADIVSLSHALLFNSVLTKLNLQCNYIGPKGAASLGQALLANSTLTKLKLQNSIGPGGAACLGQALLVNSTLTELDLSRNQIGDAGAANLGQVLLTNSTLTGLDLSENQIGDKGAASLGQALLMNSTLRELDLSENYIKDAGAASIGQALIFNSTLTHLDLGGTFLGTIGDAGITSLGQALVSNSTLIKLPIKFSSIIHPCGMQIIPLIKRNIWNEIQKKLTLFDAIIRQFAITHFETLPRETKFEVNRALSTKLEKIHGNGKTCSFSSRMANWLIFQKVASDCGIDIKNLIWGTEVMIRKRSPGRLQELPSSFSKRVCVLEEGKGAE